MHLHPVLSALFVVAVGVLWLIRKDLVDEPVSNQPSVPRKMELSEVQVRSFQSGRARVLDLRGRRVVSNATHTEMQLEPVEGVVTENGAQVVRFRADRGSRQPSKAGEQLVFQGSCNAVSSDGKAMQSEEIHYYPRSGQLSSPARATVVTSDARVTGDRFETSIQMRTGVVTGHVSIISSWIPAGQNAGPRTTGSGVLSPAPKVTRDEVRREAGRGNEKAGVRAERKRPRTSRRGGRKR